MRGFKKFFALTAVVSAMAIIASGVVVADEAVVDGDGLAPVSANALAFGEVCANTTVTKDVLFAITRSTNGNPNIFANGSTATVSVGTISGSGLSATIAAPGTIGLAANWSSSPMGSTSAAVRSSVTFQAGAAGTILSGSISYGVTGTAMNNAAIARTATLPVSATVVSCDTTPPTLHLPTAHSVEAEGPAGAAVTYTATATDVAPLAPAVSCVPTSGSTFALGTTTVTCSATDAAGNTATGSFPITVTDTTGPVLSGTPTDVTTEATGATGVVVEYTAPTATDLVDGSRPVECSPPSGALLPLGSNIITCTASDSSGNSSTTSFAVTVVDTTSPTLTLPGDLTVEATGPDGATADYTATATDAVDGELPVECQPAAGARFPLGETTVACTVADSRGNETSGSFAVSVVDTTAPDLDVPDAFSVEATGPAGASITYSASASDLVDGDVAIACSPESGSTLPLGATTVTCTAADATGNTSTSEFTVTVVDTTGPSLSLPADITVEATGPTGAVVSFSASATDLVDGVVGVSCLPASGSAFPVGATTVTCTAADSRGNPATGELTITVTDTTAPELKLPGDLVLEATGADGAVADFATTAFDIVDGPLEVTCDPAPGSTFALGTSTVRCTAVDAAGNTSTDTFEVTVVDTTAPALSSAPTDVEIEAEGAAGAVLDYTPPTATDLVDGPVEVSCEPAPGSTFPLDVETTVVCSAVDAAGNLASTTFGVRVSDRTAPTLVLPADITAEATGPDGARVPFEPSAVDLVDGAVPVGCAPPSGSTFGLGPSQVDCSATDARDNTATGSFTVTVVDTTPPELVVPDDVTVEATGPNGAEVTYAVSATDLVDGDVVPDCDTPSGSTLPLGETTIECSATDAHGNTSTASFLVEVVDTTAPDLTLPGPLTVEATGPTGAVVEYTASASDLVDGPVTVSCTEPAGLFALGETVVSCAATDAAGNTATGSFPITVVDTTAPTLLLPSGVTAEATSAAGAAVLYDASAVDVVDGPLHPTCSPSSGATFALGSTEVECSIVDAAGNRATGSFVVEVRDTTAPTISSTPTDLVAEAQGPDGSSVTYTSPTAFDLVDGEVPVVCSPGSGSTFPLDTATTVTCVAVDAAGNRASSGFSVTVQDSTAPTLTLPAPMVVEATGPAGAAVSFAPSAVDLVDGEVAVSCTPGSGSQFALGETTVRCSAVDAHDNATDGSFTVAVVDTTAPALELAAGVTAEATGPAGAQVTYPVSATDVVDGALTPSCDVPSGSTFAIGTTTVTCSVTDAAGNVSQGSFDVVVRDTTAPALTLPTSVEVLATSPAGAAAAWNASAQDVVDGATSVRCTPGAGSTFAPGVTRVECTTTDAHGNTATGGFDVTVTFDLSDGFLAPVRSDVVNTVKGGSTVPLKWRVTGAGGGYIGSTSMVSRFVLAQVNCSTLATTVDEVEFTTTGATSLRYEGNQFVQNWQTPKKAGACYRVDVVFVGGLQRLSATFQLK